VVSCLHETTNLQYAQLLKTLRLELDSNSKRLTITPFMNGQLQNAADAYLQVEKATADNPEIQTVLVSVDSIEALRQAYPNYYLDTGEFVEAMKRIIQ